MVEGDTPKMAQHAQHAQHDEHPYNRADFSDDDSFQEKVEKHNENVAETMDRAKDGDTINLSDLIADKEQLHIEDVERRHGGDS